GPRVESPPERPLRGHQLCRARRKPILNQTPYGARTSPLILTVSIGPVIGRNRAKLRRSPLMLYWRAGNVTLRPPPPPRRSQIENPINLSPASGSSVKCSSASASFPGGFPLSFGVILIVTMNSPFEAEALLPRARAGPHPHTGHGRSHKPEVAQAFKPANAGLKPHATR